MISLSEGTESEKNCSDGISHLFMSTVVRVKLTPFSQSIMKSRWQNGQLPTLSPSSLAWRQHSVSKHLNLLKWKVFNVQVGTLNYFLNKYDNIDISIKIFMFLFLSNFAFVHTCFTDLIIRERPVPDQCCFQLLCHRNDWKYNHFEQGLDCKRQTFTCCIFKTSS